MARYRVIERPPGPEVPVDDTGLPPWMATFADMVTLLFCFFVLMLSFAEQDAQKFRDVMGSLKDTFGAKVVRSKTDELNEMTTSSTKDKAAPASDPAKTMSGVVVRLKSLMESQEQTQRATGVAAEREGALLKVSSGLLFEPGQSRPSRQARRTLDQVVAVLREYPVYLVVRGHTSNLPPPPGRYPSNWELSAARSANTLSYLVEIGGVPVNRVKAVGYADTRPIADNTTEQGRLANERIEFFFHHPEKDSW